MSRLCNIAGGGQLEYSFLRTAKGKICGYCHT